MPRREDVSYFGAGPAPLPTAVLEDAARAILNYNDMGIGIAEISHRSPEANKILADTKDSLSELLSISKDYEILFLQSGGSGEFSAVVYHMVGLWVERQRLKLEKTWRDSQLDDQSDERKLEVLRQTVKKSLRLDYLITGSWSLKASQEAARLVGSEYVHVATDAREHNDGKFGAIPPEATWNLKLPADDRVEHHPMQPAFTYYCDNETVDGKLGVEFPGFPTALDSDSDATDRLVVADMSSNFLSRSVDVRKYAVIFGGAQKNVGTTGITIVVVRKSLLPPQANLASPQLMRRLGLPVGPIVFDWPTIAMNNSLYNTLPILEVWIAGQVMKRLVDEYGVKRIHGQEEMANQKAQLIYKTLDALSDVYQIVPKQDARSRMNICLRVNHGDVGSEKKFLEGAEERLLLGLKGHRSVGGIRISNYNAVSLQAVEKIVRYLNEFAKSDSITSKSGAA